MEKIILIDTNCETPIILAQGYTNKTQEEIQEIANKVKEEFPNNAEIWYDTITDRVFELQPEYLKEIGVDV